MPGKWKPAFLIPIIAVLSLCSTATCFAAQRPVELYDQITKFVHDEFYDGRARTPEFDRIIAHYRKGIKTRDDAILAARTVIARLGDPYSWLLDEKIIERRAEKQSGVKRLPPANVRLTMNGKEQTRRVPVITEKLAVQASLIDERTALLTITDFDNRLMPQQLQRAVTTMNLSAAKNLIVDLRGNTGGFISNAAQALGFLMGSAQNIATLQTAHGDRPLNLVWPAANPQFRGRLIVLVDRRTASASELVAATIRNRKRGLLVGETTAGANLWKGDHVIEPGLVLYLSFGQWSMQPGKFSGVLPDKIVERKAGARDNQLEAAIQLLRD